MQKIIERDEILGIEFLVFLLDEPFPDLWPMIVEILDKFDQKDYPIIGSTFSQITNSPYKDRLDARAAKIYSVAEKYKQFYDKSLKEKILNITGIDRREIDFITNLPKTTDYDTWYPLIWRRVIRNLAFLLKNEPRWDDDYVQVDSKLMQYFIMLLSENLVKDTPSDITVSLFGIWFNDQIGRGQYAKMIGSGLEKILSSEPFQNVDWVVNHLLRPFILFHHNMDSSFANSNPKEILKDYIIKQLHSSGELKHIMAMTGFLNSEIIQIDKFNIKTMEFTEREQKGRSRSAKPRKIVDDKNQRDLLFTLMSELGNKLIKEDQSLGPSIDGLFGPIANLKKTIEDRRCCQTNGRNGDRYCNVCARVIPDEMIVR